MVLKMAYLIFVLTLPTYSPEMNFIDPTPN